MAHLAIQAHPWCAVCETTTDLTGDHIVPIIDGGLNVPSNIRVLCRPCNSRAGAERGNGVTGGEGSSRKPQTRSEMTSYTIEYPDGSRKQITDTETWQEPLVVGKDLVATIGGDGEPLRAVWVRVVEVH